MTGELERRAGKESLKGEFEIELERRAGKESLTGELEMRD